jgi:hypothetical protein
MCLEPPESSGERGVLDVVPICAVVVLLSRARRAYRNDVEAQLTATLPRRDVGRFPLGGRIGALPTRAGTNTIRRERLHSSMAWRTREPSVATYCVPRDTTEDMR